MQIINSNNLKILKRSKLTQNSKGFTLIELLVVISIIALLSSLVIAALSSARKKARDSERLAEAHQIAIALEQYSDSSGGSYAVTGAGLSDTGTGPISQTGVSVPTRSILAALSQNNLIAGKSVNDPTFTDQNYYVSNCANGREYSLLVKLEGSDRALSTNELLARCGGDIALSSGYNYIISLKIDGIVRPTLGTAGGGSGTMAATSNLTSSRSLLKCPWDASLGVASCSGGADGGTVNENKRFTFNPVTGVVNYIDSLPLKIVYHACVAKDGTTYCFGGRSPGYWDATSSMFSYPTASAGSPVYQYDFFPDTFSMNDCVLVTGSSIAYCAGLVPWSGTKVFKIDLSNLAAGPTQIKSYSSDPNNFYAAAGCVYSSLRSKVYCMGGQNALGNGLGNQVLSIDTTNDNVTQLAVRYPTPNTDTGSVACVESPINRYIYCYGAGWINPAQIYEFNPATETFTTIPETLLDSQSTCVAHPTARKNFCIGGGTVSDYQSGIYEHDY